MVATIATYMEHACNGCYQKLWVFLQQPIHTESMYAQQSIQIYLRLATLHYLCTPVDSLAAVHAEDESCICIN